MDSVAEVNVYSNVSVWSGIDSFKMDLKHLHKECLSCLSISSCITDRETVCQKSAIQLYTRRFRREIWKVW